MTTLISLHNDQNNNTGKWKCFIMHAFYAY